MIETRLSIRVGDLEEAIQGTYGSLEAFQESLRAKADEEPFSEVVYEALTQGRHDKDEVMDLRTVWYGDKMPPFGISQMEVLNEIMQEPPHSIRDLAKRMGKNFETVREHVLLLESQGLVWVDRRGRGRRAPVHPVPNEFTVSITRPKPDATTSNLLNALHERRQRAQDEEVAKAKAEEARRAEYAARRADGGSAPNTTQTEAEPAAKKADDADSEDDEERTETHPTSAGY